MKIFILTTLLLTGCGAENQLKTDENGNPIFNTPAIQHQPNEKEVVIEYRKDGDQTAAVVEDTNNLPACSNNNFDTHAYVKRLSKFFTCKGTAWLEDVSEQVLQTPAEIAKDQAFKPAKETEASTETKPERVYSNSTYYGTENFWIDPITKRVWSYTGRRSFEDALKICDVGFALPSVSEAQEAIRNGLLAAITDLAGINAPEELWTNESALGTIGRFPDLMPVPASVSASGEVHGVHRNPIAGPACVKVK